MSVAGPSFSTWLAFHHAVCGIDNDETGYEAKDGIYDEVKVTFYASSVLQDTQK